MPMPITSSYATLHETAKMKMLTSGNGAGGDDMSANNTGVPPQLLRPMALPLVVHGQQQQQQVQQQGQQQQQAPQPMDTNKAQVLAMVPLQQQQQPQQPPLQQQQQQALPPTVVVTPGSTAAVSLLTTPTGAAAAAAAAGTPTSGVGGGGGFTPTTTPAPAKKAVRYRECHKNHAASIGGHAIDGCGEFMPSGEEGTPDALKCAACSCHRNFHRREVEGEPSCDCHLLRAGAAAGGLGGGSSLLKDSRKRPAPSVSGGAGSGGAPSPIGLAGMAAAATPTLALPSTLALRAGAGGVGGAPTPILMALSSGAADSDDQEGGLGSASPAAMKKRFRTKFSSEQKEKMCSFADKLGWKIQKHDEAAVQQFCSDVGVKRHVLKVWMHNNKHTLGKKM